MDRVPRAAKGMITFSTSPLVNIGSAWQVLICVTTILMESKLMTKSIIQEHCILVLAENCLVRERQ